MSFFSSGCHQQDLNPKLWKMVFCAAKTLFYVSQPPRIVAWRNRPLCCSLAERIRDQTTQPCSSFNLNVDYIHPSFCCMMSMYVAPNTYLGFQQFSFMAMTKMWIVVCPSKLIKIHWEKDTGQNHVLVACVCGFWETHKCLTFLLSCERFILSEEDDMDSTWEKRLVKRYYDKLFKEYPFLYILYCIALPGHVSSWHNFVK